MAQTLLNLAQAFVGESQARNRYAFYAKIAKKEGYEQIAEIFLLTADNEKEHAKRIFEHIQELKETDKIINVEAAVPTVYGSTQENLEAAIKGEHYEYTQMYPEFAKVAQKEGYPKIAQRFKKLLKEIKAGAIFKKEKEVWWVCRECGYVHFGKTPPKACPSCDHPQSFYQVKCEKY